MNLEEAIPAGRGGAPQPSDEELAARVRSGEVALFEVLMRRSNPRVYHAIRSILRDEGEVEDAMQQAYLDAFLHLDQFAGGAAFSTWLTRIAVNEALGRLRGRARLVLVGEGEAEPDGSTEDFMRSPPETPEERAAVREATALLERAVDDLPRSYRTVFMLREVEGLSTAETGQALGLTEETVKMRLHRGRLALKDALLQVAGQAATSAFPFFAPRCDRVVTKVMALLPKAGTQ
ncbi:MAG TPA: RNA polymerase sigma factor [Anaeromyxobacteraceae bacterium]